MTLRAAFLLTLLSAFVLAGCARPDPEQQLRETISGLQDSLEQRGAGGISEVLAEDFIGPGGLDREAAARLARGLSMRHRETGVLFGPLDVQLGEGHATVEFTATLSGGSGRLMPGSVGIYSVQTGWRHEAGQWRMTSARWTPRL